MKPINAQTDAELSFNMSDAIEAIRAMPEGANVSRYLSERDLCRDEIARRTAKRIVRNTAEAYASVDPLKYPIKIRRSIKARNSRSDFRKWWYSAVYSLAYDRINREG